MNLADVSTADLVGEIERRRLVKLRELDEIDAALSQVILNSPRPLDRRAGGLVRAASRIWAVAPTEILAPTRATAPTEARLAVMYLLRGYSSVQVAKVLQRDHTAVLHAWRRVPELLKSNSAFSARLDELETAANIDPP